MSCKIFLGWALLLSANPAIAEQTLESLDSVAPAIAAEIGPAISEPAAEIAAPGSEAEEKPRNNLPAVGFVPGYDPNASHFDLVADVAPESDRLFLSASRAEREGSPEQALKLIRDTLDADAAHPRAALAHGRLLFKTGQHELAITILKDLVKDRTDDWRPWFWLGSSYLITGDLPAAERALEEALSRNSQVVEIWIHRALIAAQRNEWRTAMQLLTIAQEIAPNHPMVLLNIGITSDALGLKNNAKTAYRKFLTHSDRAHVSNVVRYEVINHLGGGDIGAAAVADATDTRGTEFSVQSHP
ncbi:MAG: Flp pilus assembly protein TadD [Gammaproteobacteria bacterium]|jgi:Flp pilus assembly protein TadD